MARTEARIKCSIWDDEDYRRLPFEAQWLYEAILSQKDLSLCGVLTWTPKRFSKLAPNASPTIVRKALDALRERRYVVLDDETDELWVRTFITNDRVLDNPNSVIGMSHDFGAIHSQPIRDGLVDGLGDGFLDGLPQRFKNGLPKGFHDRLAKPFLDALALASGRPPPPAHVPPASSLQPPLLTNTDPPPTSIDAADEPAEEEDRDRVAEVCERVAQRRHDKRSEPIPEGVRRDRWLAATAADVRASSLDNIPLLLGAGRTVDEVVDLFEPPDRPHPPEPVPSREQQPPVFDIDEESGLAVRVSA